MREGRSSGPWASGGSFPALLRLWVLCGEPSRERPTPSHLSLVPRTRPAAPAPGAASHAQPWLPGGRAVEPHCSHAAASRAPGPGALQPAPPNGPAPPRPQRGSRGGAPPAWHCPPRLFRRGPTAAGSCRPLVLGAGHTPELLVPHAQRPSSQGPRVRASTCPANWHPLAATPTPRRLSGHPSQTTPFTAWPWVLNASRE